MSSSFVFSLFDVAVAAAADADSAVDEDDDDDDDVQKDEKAGQL